LNVASVCVGVLSAAIPLGPELLSYQASAACLGSAADWEVQLAPLLFDQRWAPMPSVQQVAWEIEALPEWDLS
jgi:hypothetical protein